MEKNITSLSHKNRLFFFGYLCYDRNEKEKRIQVLGISCKEIQNSKEEKK